MKRTTVKILLFYVFAFLPCWVNGQNGKPFWMDNDVRNMQYPSDTYYSGFAIVSVGNSENVENATARAKQAAISELSERIRVAVNNVKQSKTISIDGTNIDEQIYKMFSSVTTTNSQTEVVGSKIETYFDKQNKEVYAFAYTNKYELTGYYKSNLSVNIGQIESFVKTAQDLEANGEKAKARQQLENAHPIFSKIRFAQDILTALDSNISAEDLQQEKSETFYNTFMQMQARLAQAIYVYVENREDLLGTKVDIVANKVKAELAANGCSFVENQAQADFLLKIDVSTRTSSQFNGLFFCYADTQINLYDVRKQKTIYNDEISEKGGSNTQEKAGRMAMNNTVIPVVEKLKNWINN